MWVISCCDVLFHYAAFLFLTQHILNDLEKPVGHGKIFEYNVDRAFCAFMHEFEYTSGLYLLKSGTLHIRKEKHFFVNISFLLQLVNKCTGDSRNPSGSCYFFQIPRNTMYILWCRILFIILQVEAVLSWFSWSSRLVFSWISSASYKWRKHLWNHQIRPKTCTCCLLCCWAFNYIK